MPCLFGLPSDRMQDCAQVAGRELGGVCGYLRRAGGVAD